MRSVSGMTCGVVLAAVMGVAAVGRAAVTMDQAKAFFKDFDTQTLSGTGANVNQVCGVTDPTNAAQVAAAKRG